MAMIYLREKKISVWGKWMKIRETLLNLFGCGVVAYCRCGQQTYVNQHADKILRDEAVNIVLQKAITAAMRRSLVGGGMALGPEMVEAAHGDSLERMLISIVRIPRDPEGCPDTEEYVCFLVDLNQGVDISPEKLVELFKLSNRESLVASHLLKPCMTDADVARAIGVSLNTVKSHIKKIYVKTESNSRSELIRKLMLMHLVVPTRH
jgi:DNA-binding CsgD family transcriptional regulator